MMNKVQQALELRRALQFFLASLDPDTEMEKIVQVASVFPNYQVGKAYKTKDIFQWGVNSLGDAQLYQVLQDHTSAQAQPPDTSSSLYKKVAVGEDGIPLWVQPLGASDAYMTGDVVLYNGVSYRSLIDYNVWAPDAYPAGWQTVS